MNIGGYPINPINRINNKLPWVIDQEYKVWYWHTGGKASETPLEPLTQEFWRMKRDSRLVHGLHLPQFDRRYGGDLLILVTQRLDCAIQKDYGGLTIFQRNDLYKLILEVYFIHVTIIRTRPIKEQIEFFQSCERSFEEKILPKKNQHGEYYRGVRKDLPETGALQLNEKGRVNCPNCNFGIGFGSGTMITYQKRTGIETRLIHVKCKNCNTQLEIYVDVIPEVQDAKLVEGVTL